MAKYAVGNPVQNLILADTKEIAELITGQSCIEYTDETPVNIGWTYDGTQFINPQEESNSDTLA
jgi:hypothetical protein